MKKSVFLIEQIATHLPGEAYHAIDKHTKASVIGFHKTKSTLDVEAEDRHDVAETNRTKPILSVTHLKKDKNRAFKTMELGYSKS